MPQTILVTGAGRGIGFEIAKRLAFDGFNLVLVTKSSDSVVKLKSTIDTWLGHHIICALDIADCNALTSFIDNWELPIWALVNNAGICNTMNLDSRAELDPWESVIKTNLEAPYRLAKGLLPYISQPGRIVNISSQLGLEGRAGYSAYCASKFGLIGLTKVWAKELGVNGITVNAICPGWVDTEMSRQDIIRLAHEKGVTAAEYYEEICKPLELKRFNSPQEVADLASYLISDGAAGVSGRSWLMQTIWNQE